MPPRTRSQPDTARSILYALAANLAIAIAKFAGAVFTGSGSLLAESFHSLADTGNEGLLLLGRRQARAAPTPRHPLGQGRATYFWSFIVALMLFLLGGLLSIYEGVRKWRNPVPLDDAWVAVAIVIFAMIAEGLSLRFTMKQIAKVRGGRSLWRWFRDTRRSELIVVLGEDIAAIAGLSIALAALAATIATGKPTYDAFGSIAIGALLMIVATGLAIEIKSLLIGESAAPPVEQAIRELLLAQRDVVAIDRLITTQHGDYVVIAIQARMKTDKSANELIDSIVRCKAALREAFPNASWIFFEPTAEKARDHQRAARAVSTAN